MAKIYLNLDSANTCPVWFLELCPFPNMIATQSVFSVPNRDLLFGVQLSPGISVIRSAGNQLRKKFRLLQAIMIDFPGRSIGAFVRRTRSSSVQLHTSQACDRTELCGSRIATQKQQSHFRTMAPSTGNHESFPQIADDRVLACRVRNFFVRILPDQGIQKKQNQMRRLLRACIGPIDRQKRLNQNEKNNVNQRLASGRESNCDRRRQSA